MSDSGLLPPSKLDFRGSAHPSIQGGPSLALKILQSMSGILIAKALGERKVEKLDIPKKLAQIVITFQDKDLC